MSVSVPRTFTRKTHKPVAKALPLPVFFMRNAINRSKVGAKLTARAKRGTLKYGGRINTSPAVYTVRESSWRWILNRASFEHSFQSQHAQINQKLRQQ